MKDNYQNEYNETIKAAEFAWLKKRRQLVQSNNTDNLAPKSQNTITDDLTGLALSGGGVRSATFNLGVLQALEKEQILKDVDYLSSVSGGGYIASSFTWFKTKLNKQFPFGSTRIDHKKLGGSVLAWLRSHASYLTPGNGINKMSLFTAIFASTLINLLIIVPLFVYGLFLSIVPFIPTPDFFNHGKPLNLLHILELLGKGSILLSFICILLAALSTGIPPFLSRRTEQLRKAVTCFFSWGFLLFFIGSIPNMHHYYEDFIASSVIIALIGGLLIFFSAKQSKDCTGANKYKALLISFGLLLICFSFFMLTYHLAKDWVNTARSTTELIFIVLVIFALFLARFCNINLVSMHGYYRNRLRDAFMPYQVPDVNDPTNQHVHNIATWQAAQHCYLAELPITDAPYHLINCNIELTGSIEPKYRNRAGDCFVLSPLYCGASSTGYAKTSDYVDGTMDLASACAISGAAVATNTCLVRSKPLNFIMALFNLRLGYWTANPKQLLAPKKFFKKPAWFYYMFRDMFGHGLDENRNFIHLSDGGHFENLGVYELVRRQCRTIISIDSGADPHFYFHDLAKLTELIRVDFGAKLTIDTSPLLPDENGISAQAWVVGSITYQDESKAQFIYIKSAMIKHLSADIYGYKRQTPTFPNQSTVDQFFDEFQFEAYRELGFQITHQLFNKHPHVVNVHLKPQNNNKDIA